MNNTPQIPSQQQPVTANPKKNFLVGGLIVLGSAGFLIAIYSYLKSQTKLLKEFKYKILDFGIREFTMQTIKGTLVVQFTSVAEIEVVIKEFFVDFYFNQKRIGYVSSNQKMLVPAKSTTRFSFDYTLNPQLVFTNLTDIIEYTTRQKDASIKIVGKALVKSGFITLPLPIEYNTTVKEILKT